MYNSLYGLATTLTHHWLNQCTTKLGHRSTNNDHTSYLPRSSSCLSTNNNYTSYRHQSSSWFYQQRPTPIELYQFCILWQINCHLLYCYLAFVLFIVLWLSINLTLSKLKIIYRVDMLIGSASNELWLI